jgi:hypothetical protein
MNTTEDRLLAAIRETAAEIAPGSTRPLSLPEPSRQAGRPHLRLHGGWHPSGWRRAVAAAASVIVVIAAALAITGGGGTSGRVPGAQSPAEKAALASVPPYYLALTGYTGNLNEHWHATVRSTATGAILATISPPRPYRTFGWLSGAADDRTFVLAAQSWVPGASPAQNSAEPTRFFVLHFDPATGQAPLTALPISERQGHMVNGMAVSPDGSKLAVIVQTQAEPSRARELQVFTLASGSQRQWVWPGKGWIGNLDQMDQPLSWGADSRTLAFQQWTGQHGAVRLLDTAAPGGSLMAAARLGVMFRGADSDVGNALLIPDGTKIVAAVFPPGTGNQVKTNITEFSVRTGNAIRVRDPWQFVLGGGPDPGDQVLWTNSSGRTLIVISPPGTDPAGHFVHHAILPVIGVLTGDRFTPIPGSPRASQNIEAVAW